MSLDLAVQAANQPIINILTGISRDDLERYYGLLWLRATGAVNTGAGFDHVAPSFGGTSNPSLWPGRDEQYFLNEVASMASKYDAGVAITGVAGIRANLALSAMQIIDRDQLQSHIAVCKALFWRYAVLPTTGGVS